MNYETSQYITSTVLQLILSKLHCSYIFLIIISVFSSF